jgi:hypothetical protein
MTPSPSQARGGMKRAAAWVAAAGAVALVPLPPALVERLYSSAVYPRLQSRLTQLSNLAPVALLDVAIGAAALAWLGPLAADIVRRRPWRTAAARMLVRTATGASIVYLVFVACWGLNYRRLRLPDKIEFEAEGVGVEEARILASQAVAALNARYDDAHAELARTETVTPALEAPFDAVQRALGIEPAAQPGRPKHTLLDWYFKSAAIDGMTDPFFLETLIVSDLLPVERPFVIAHEWAHLAGFAHEGEANFIGWLTCAQGSAAAQYSGWLFLYREVVRTLSEADRTAAASQLHGGPLADLRATALRLRRNVNPAVSEVGWRVYDRYLKVNQIEAGTASYTEVVRLVLGARLGNDGLPRPRAR